MLVHLVPYERVYLSVTMSLDEATEVADALELIKSIGRDKGLSASAEKLQQLLASGIAKAIAYQQRKGTI